MTARKNEPVTVDAFLAFLDRQRDDSRYELVDGEIIAMSGGSMVHEMVGSNVAYALREIARPRGCRAHRADLGIRQSDADDFLAYPDVFVRCGPVSRDRSVTDPLIIVEVLSPSTIDFDRGQKLIRYKLIPTVQQVLLVDQDRPLVESWVRGSDGAFDRHLVSGLAGVVSLPALDGQVTMAAIYDDVPFDQP